MSEYCDILWVEDFDTRDDSSEERETENCYDDDKHKRSFRVERQKYMLPLLEKLMDEKNFSKYSCAVLDINLEKGFGYYDTLEDEDEKSGDEELSEIEGLLNKNFIMIRSGHNIDKNDDEFKKNAGYYVYLYLIHLGMPPSRICMLTANKGKKSNLTTDWENQFKKAGLEPPKAFAKDKNGFKDFHDWLGKTLTPAFRLRACIIGMSFYAEKILEDDELKIHVQNLHRIPLRLSEDKEIASPEFISALWQIVQPWESNTDKNYAYQTTLKTTRNWFAHRCLKKISLLTAAFLFGIGLRGLLGADLRKKLDTRTEDENLNGYKRWENELLALIGELDKEKPPAGKKEMGELVIRSCQEFFTRVRKIKVELTTDISNLIQEIIGQKKKYDIERREEDLLRDFLHGVYPIKWRGDGLAYENHKLGILFELDKDAFKSLENSKEAKYLNAVKNTLAQAIEGK